MQLEEPTRITSPAEPHYVFQAEQAAWWERWELAAAVTLGQLSTVGTVALCWYLFS